MDGIYGTWNVEIYLTCIVISHTSNFNVEQVNLEIIDI
jgi:hypothetical protein